LFPGAVRCGYIAADRIRGQIVDIAVPASSQHDGVRCMGCDPAGDQVADHNPSRMPLVNDEVEHVGARAHGDPAAFDLPAERRIRTQEQLLTGLAPRVKGPRHLCASKRAVVQRAAVFTGKRDALGHALVYNIVAHLGQAVNIGLPGPEVTALDGVIKEAED